MTLPEGYSLPQLRVTQTVHRCPASGLYQRYSLLPRPIKHRKK